MEEDPLFCLDIVRDFIISKGGKVRNHDLVTHFKSFLNDPRRKDSNRQKFKSFVNTLATVKLDPSGEKLLVLKKKYRADSDYKREETKPDHKEKLEVQPRKVQDDSSWKTSQGASESTASNPDTGGLLESFLAATSAFSRADEDVAPSPGKPSDNVEDVSMDDSEPPQEIEIVSGSSEFKDHISQGVMSFDHPSANQASHTETPDTSGVEESLTELAPMPSSVAEISPIAEEPMESSTDEVLVEEDFPEPVKVIAAEFKPSMISELKEPMEAEEADVVSPIASEPPVGDEVTPPDAGLAKSTAMSVKERAKHLNRMTSESELSSTILKKQDEMEEEAVEVETGQLICPVVYQQTFAEAKSHEAVVVPLPTIAEDLVKDNTPKIQSSMPIIKGPLIMKHTSKASPTKDDEDSHSGSVVTVTLDETEREWMLASAAADYHPMAKLLLKNPHLASHKDFMSTALHWAGKHGKIEVVKLLCGTGGNVPVDARSGYTPLHLAAMNGHEEIIEILVQVYNANPNLRDYSGKKAKQYLRNSASTRSQQLLQARRLSTNVVIAGPGAMQVGAPFRRVGSYSSKIKTAGHFGITAGAGLRHSWTASDQSGTPSPGPSPRESPSTSRKSSTVGEGDLMPPPKEVPTRRKRRKQKLADKENNSDSEMVRSGSDNDLPHRQPVTMHHPRDTSV